MKTLSRLTVLLMVIAPPLACYAQVTPRHPEHRQPAPAVAIPEDHHAPAHRPIIVEPPVSAPEPDLAHRPYNAPEHPFAHHRVNPSAAPALHPHPEREV